jgi:tRNA 2-thiouridine synthesizing protein B
MLHIFRESPLQSPRFELCLDYLADVDALLLIEDGVYGAALNLPRLKILAGSGRLFVLIDDAQARGIDIDQGQGITMGQWVQLTAEHANCLTW